MVKAIDFVVRDSAGGIVRGSVAGEGSNFVQLGMGEEISLNLARESVAGFVQQGSDLVITLIDGRQVVLAGYFNEAGEPNQLYLSQNGEVVAVELTNAGDGTLYAAYGPSEGWDKFSTLDDLRFGNSDDLALAAGATDEPAGMAGFLPGLVGLGGVGAGLAGLGLVGGLIGGGGGGGGGGSTGPRPPTVNDPTSSQTVMTESTDKTLDVSGTGQPGDKVVVTVGDKTKETTIGTDGTWSVVFPETGLPADGTHETVVVFTHVATNTTTTLDGPTFVVDMTPPAVEVTDGAKSTGDVENAAEYANGVSISGEGEVGATIVVKVGTHTQTTTVDANGNWTVTFPTTQIQTGEYEIPFTVTATDKLGNDTVLNDVLVVDTVPHPIGFNSVTADNLVNGAEASGGFQISGTSTAGATLTVTVGTITQTVTVGANGTWTASFAAGQLPAGEYDATVTATTTDAAGNPSTASHSFRVDTTTSVAFSATAVEGDNTVNAFEAMDGVVLTGTTQAGNTVNVLWNGATLPATVNADGTWSVTFPSVPGGTYSSTATVTATDAAGNSATATRTINIDTETTVSFDATQAGDNTISGAERNAGVSLTGRAEAGATVEVTLQGTTRTVTADANGNWSARFTSGEIPAGTYSTVASVMATDKAGNKSLSEQAVNVDTEVVPLEIETKETGADSVLNFSEAANGLVITGQVEANATSVMVKLGNGTAVPATVSFDGSWTVTIPANQIPAGENTLPISVTATDRYNNVSTITSSVEVDTLVRNFAHTNGQIGGDGTINAAEAAAGVTMSGTVEPNSTVVVRLPNNSMKTVTAGANGAWSVTFDAAELPAGTGSATATFTATDPAGNTKTFTETFAYDTAAPDALNAMKIVRDGEEVTGIFTGPNGDDVSIHRVDSNGVAREVGHDVNENVSTFINGVRVTADSYEFDTGVPDGSYLVIGNTDAAGNEASTLLIVDNTNTVNVDLQRDGLSQFDFSAIDLSFAPQASLTLTAADLEALTGPDKQLVINGGTDDSVSLVGATLSTETVSGYTVYNLGSGTVLVEDDIINTNII